MAWTILVMGSNAMCVERSLQVRFNIMGLTHREIAEQLDRSEEATRALLNRALARLSLLMGMAQDR